MTRGQNLEHLSCFFDFDGMEFVFEQQALFRVDSLFDLRPHGLAPTGGERGQNLDHLRFKIYFCFKFS